MHQILHTVTFQLGSKAVIERAELTLEGKAFQEEERASAKVLWQSPWQVGEGKARMARREDPV